MNEKIFCLLLRLGLQWMCSMELALLPELAIEMNLVETQLQTVGEIQLVLEPNHVSFQ